MQVYNAMQVGSSRVNGGMESVASLVESQGGRARIQHFPLHVHLQRNCKRHNYIIMRISKKHPRNMTNNKKKYCKDVHFVQFINKALRVNFYGEQTTNIAAFNITAGKNCRFLKGVRDYIYCLEVQPISSSSILIFQRLVRSEIIRCLEIHSRRRKRPQTHWFHCIGVARGGSRGPGPPQLKCYQ